MAETPKTQLEQALDTMLNMIDRPLEDVHLTRAEFVQAIEDLLKHEELPFGLTKAERVLFDLCKNEKGPLGHTIGQIRGNIRRMGAAKRRAITKMEDGDPTKETRRGE